MTGSSIRVSGLAEFGWLGLDLHIQVDGRPVAIAEVAQVEPGDVDVRVEFQRELEHDVVEGVVAFRVAVGPGQQVTVRPTGVVRRGQ